MQLHALQNDVIYTGNGSAHAGLAGIPGLIARSLMGFRGDAIDAMDRMRLDSDAALGKLLCEQFGIRVDAEDFARVGMRADSSTAARGLYLARQLEYRLAEVLREPERDLNGFDVIPQDTSTPPGAKEITATRLYMVGDAVVYRGGNQGIPRVALSQEEERWRIKHFANSFGTSLFDRQSAAFANFSQEAELLAGCRTIMMRLVNRLIWDGSSIHKIQGILNYKWLAKRLVATLFDGTADPDDVLAALNRGANYPAATSDGLLKPDSVAMTQTVYDYLSTTKTGSFSDRTILEHWFATNSLGIKKVTIAWELRAKGPGGTDGILFYRNDKKALRHMLVQAFTTTPVQHSVFEDVIYCYMSSGGVIMPENGHNILLWVTPPSA